RRRGTPSPLPVPVQCDSVVCPDRQDTMAKIEELLSRVTDPELRAALAREIQKIKSNIRFGLVYEEHVPEVLKLPNLPVRPGVLATPDDDSDIQRPWLVERIEGEIAFCS